MTKRGAIFKTWKRRFFVLRSNRTLAYFSDEPAKVPPPSGLSTVQPKGVIDLKAEGLSVQMGADVDQGISWLGVPQSHWQLRGSRRIVSHPPG